MKKKIASVIFVFLTCSFFAVHAAESSREPKKPEDVKIDESELIVEEDDVVESPQWYGFSFKMGDYVPPTTRGVFGDFQANYGGRTGIWGEFTVEVQPITSWGILGVRGSAGYHYISGTQSNFTNIPLQGGAIYHFKYKRHQILVPFVESGLGYYLLEQTKRNAYTRERQGYYGSGGIQLNFNGFETRTADRFDLNYGINNTYLTVEYRLLRTPSAGVLDLGGEFFLAGFMMEF